MARGERLVALAGCDLCHTPQLAGPSGAHLDFSRRLSGHSTVDRSNQEGRHPWESLIPSKSPNTVFASPWGEQYAANLTPDRETGIGTWTGDLFVDRMIESQHWVFYSRGTSYFVQSGYSTLSARDLRSIFAYLGTLEPIENRVPDRVSAGDWKWQ